MKIYVLLNYCSMVERLCGVIFKFYEYSWLGYILFMIISRDSHIRVGC